MPDWITEEIVERVRTELGVGMDRVPRHVAIIMDGNGRWAEDRGLERIEGHRSGSNAVREVITAAAEIGIECLTLYSFSRENWKRPAQEVADLMKLYEEYLVMERETMIKHNIKFRHIGQEAGLPEAILRTLRGNAEICSANTGMTLCLALNYSGRSEMTLTVQKLARQAKEGHLDPDTIDEDMISDNLDTTGLPDPDLLIRTAGEMRISNFLLWQISYAELVVTDVYWPDFNTKVLHDGMRTFIQRNRRFGGLKKKV